MGLDSVELLMEVEKYFSIQIPDPEAEKANTVQALVMAVAKQLNVTDNNAGLRDEALENVSQTLSELGLIESPVSPTGLIHLYLDPARKEIWSAFETKMQLAIPVPAPKSRNDTSLKDKIKSAMDWTPDYDWQLITMSQFADAICARNYEKLLDRMHIKSTYEIYVAVTAITVDRIGVAFYEITPDKSFTDDLGVS